MYYRHKPEQNDQDNVQQNFYALCHFHKATGHESNVLPSGLEVAAFSVSVLGNLKHILSTIVHDESLKNAWICNNQHSAMLDEM